jgi:1-phosphofructokinase
MSVHRPSTAVIDEKASAICVLAPWLILTITIEMGPDGEDEIYLHAGGQGFWVARMIANLGCRPILCGPIGGEQGIVLKALVEAEGIELRPVAVSGWNGAYLHDRRDGDRKPIAVKESAALNRHEADDLYGAVLSAALEMGVVVLTGTGRARSLPEDFFKRLALDLGRNDVSNGPLRSLAGGVHFLKVSHEELIEAGFSRDGDREALMQGIIRLRQSTRAENLVVSCADKPAVACLGGRFFEVTPPSLLPIDHRGAGDSMTAALAVARAQHLAPVDALRLAAAAGAMNVTRRGLGTGQVESIEEVSRHVAIRDIGTPERTNVA